MPIVTVAERVEAPAQTVWEYINWHGVARLEGGLFQKIEFFGDKPEVGVTKRLHLADGLPILERLEAMDEAERTYRYRVLDNGDLPITDYRGYVRVGACGPAACCVKIECEFTPVDVTAQEWTEIWSGMERALIDQICAQLGV
jgi:hypothetical protein